MSSRQISLLVILTSLFFAGHTLFGHCVLAQGTPKQKDRTSPVSVRVAASLSFAEPGAAGRSTSPLIAQLYDSNFSAVGEVGFWLSPYVSTSAVFTYERERVRDDRMICPFAPPCYETESSNTLSLIISEARVRYHRPLGRSDLYVGVGMGYGLAWIDRTLEVASDREGSVEAERYVTGAIDGIFFAGFAYEILRAVSIYVEAGYRAFETGEFDRLSEIPEYDRTGPFTTFGFELRPFGRAPSRMPD